MCARARGRDRGQLEPAGHTGTRTSLPALPSPPALARSRSPPAARGPPSVLSLVCRLHLSHPPCSLRACDPRTSVLGAERPEWESPP